MTDAATTEDKMDAMPADIPVTICPPGKRAGLKAVARAAVASTMPAVTTATALQWPSEGRLVLPARDDRRTAQERIEAAQRADARSVALSQPHRAGVDDRMLVDPLGTFCFRQWRPRPSESGLDLNEDHRAAMYRAGQIYAEIVHQHRVLLGIGSGGRTAPEGGSVELSDAELRVKCDAARIKRENADDVLRRVYSAAVAAMVRVAVDEIAPTPYQEDLIRHCLWVLAVHFGLVKSGINSGKPYLQM